MFGDAQPCQRANAALDRALAEPGLRPIWRVLVPSIPSDDRIPVSCGRAVTVLVRFRQPWGALVQQAVRSGTARSGVAEGPTGTSVDYHDRPGSTAFLTRAETPLVDHRMRRPAELTGWSLAHREGLQVQRCETGRQYRPHCDNVDPDQPGSAAHLARGTQRMATTVIPPSTALPVAPRRPRWQASTYGRLSAARSSVRTSTRRAGLTRGRCTPPARRSSVATHWQQRAPFAAGAIGPAPRAPS